MDDEGNVTFTPDEGFTGEARIRYTATDSDGNPLETADITVTVLPELTPDTAVAQPDEPVTFNIVDNDGDIDPASIDLDPETPGIQKEITVPGQGNWL